MPTKLLGVSEAFQTGGDIQQQRFAAPLSAWSADP